MPDDVVNTPPVVEAAPEAAAEVKTPSFEETEQRYLRMVDAGKIDKFKRFKDEGATPKNDSEKSAVTVVEPKVDGEAKKVEETPKAEDKPKEGEKPESKKGKSGFARLRTMMNRQIGALSEQNRQLQARLEEVVKPKAVETPVVEAPEPQRADFETVEEYITAVRKYDKEQRQKEVTKAGEEAAIVSTRAEMDALLSRMNERTNELRALPEYEDWDDVVAEAETSGLSFTPQLQGAILQADPVLFYEFAKEPKLLTRVNRLSEKAAVAVTHADDVTAVLRHLANNPKEIAELNDLNEVRSVKFIGKIEIKIAEGVASAKGKPTASAESGTKGQETPAVKKEEPKSTPKAAEEEKPPVATRTKPEPPPRITGGSTPKGTDWTDNRDMSFDERSRLYFEATRRR